jgi:AcrR family transcriptional regulator
MSRHALKTTNTQRSIKAHQKTAEILARVGMTPTQIAAETGIPRPTVYAHLQKIRKTLREATQQDALAWRKAQLEELAAMRDVLSDAKLSPGRKVELMLSVLDREIKLTGSAAESKAVIAHVTTSDDPTIRKFKKHSSGLTDEQLESVWQFMSTLPRAPRVEVRDASWFPEPEPKLLQGETE